MVQGINEGDPDLTEFGTIIDVSKSWNRGPWFYLWLSWRHYSIIKKHDSELGHQERDRRHFGHGEQRETSLVSVHTNQKREGQLQRYSRPGALPIDNAWVLFSNQWLNTFKNSTRVDLKCSVSKRWRPESGSLNLQKPGGIMSSPGETWLNRFSLIQITILIY